MRFARSDPTRACLAAHAQTTLAVTTTFDDLTANGNCTLREAVQAANTNSAVDACPAGGTGVDQIVLSAGQTYALSLAGSSEDANQTGDLDVSTDLAVQGNGATIDAQGIDRVFDVTGGTVTLNALALTARRCARRERGQSGRGRRRSARQRRKRVRRRDGVRLQRGGPGVRQPVRCRRWRSRPAHARARSTSPKCCSPATGRATGGKGQMARSSAERPANVEAAEETAVPSP